VNDALSGMTSQRLDCGKPAAGSTDRGMVLRSHGNRQLQNSQRNMSDLDTLAKARSGSHSVRDGMASGWSNRSSNRTQRDSDCSTFQHTKALGRLFTE